MNRETIEKMWEIVKEFEHTESFGEEQSDIKRIREILSKHIIKYFYHDKYGLDLNAYKITSKEYINVNDTYADISIYRVRGDDVSYILNSEEQPNNELLMVYRHSTGSYMFGGGAFSEDKYYDPDLFDMYFEELKKYKYKYIDPINHKIYFDLEEGSKLYKDYKKICEKYQKLFDERRKKYKAEKLREQLKELEEDDE